MPLGDHDVTAVAFVVFGIVALLAILAMAIARLAGAI